MMMMMMRKVVVGLAVAALGAAAAGDEATCAEGVLGGGGDCGCAAGLNREAGERGAGNDDGQQEVSAQRLGRELREAVRDGRLDRAAAAATPLVRIPGGRFTMGTDDPQIEADGEAPAREMEVSPFLLQQMEVSVRQFAEFVLETGFVTDAETYGWSFCFLPTLSAEEEAKVTHKVDAVPWWVPVEGANWWHPDGADSDAAGLGRLDHPVVHVSHNDARAYCEWLGLRLPREAEFERASRGGLHQAMYPWGNELTPGGAFKANLWQGAFPDENLAEDGFAYSAPVDAFGPQNEYGLYNIIGNAWEWVADAWTTRHRLRDPQGGVLRDAQVELSYETMDDPTVERVKKGGSYMCHISYCYRYRTASRSSNTADSSAQNLGLRCAGDLDEKDEDQEGQMQGKEASEKVE